MQIEHIGRQDIGFSDAKLFSNMLTLFILGGKLLFL